MSLKSALCLAIMQLVVFQQLAFAHPLKTFTPVQSAAASAGRLNLNLSSTKAVMAATNLALKSAIKIQVGKQLESVSSASMLTAAEYIAAYQVSTSGKQYLQLSSQGNAVGGRFSIPLAMDQSLANLVIPQGVKLLDNLANDPTLTLSGNLIDAGKLLVFSSNSKANSFTIDANNIFITAGGLLGSGSQANEAIDFTLDAAESIVNYGTIVASGNLSFNAGGMIDNVGGSATMQAGNNLNLNAASGNFANSGMISALAGNINISAVGTSNIAFNNLSGTLSAANGAISFRNANYNGSSNINLSGGNYLSQALNLYAGSGSVEMAVGEVSGVVNTYAGCAHLSANTANLQVGTFDVAGDPYVNSSGNLDLGGTIAGPLTYLVATAGGSIYCSAAGEDIDTSAAGGNVVLAAGVTAVDNNGAISLTRSGTGGDIVLTAGQTIDGNAAQDISGFTTGGGNVTLIAMTDGAPASTNGGHVLVPGTVTITTTDGNGNAGSVTILAEASAGTESAVSLGGVNAGGVGGAVTIRSATANLAGGVIDDSTGIITGSFDSSTLQSGTLAPQAVLAGGALALATAGTINLAGTNSATSAALIATSLYLPNGTSLTTTAGALSITAAINNLTITGDNNGTTSLSAVGGQLNVSSTGSGTLLFTAQTSGDAVTFNLDSDTSVNITFAGQIIINQNVTLQNTTSAANWTLSSSAVNLEQNSAVNSNNCALTLNVNNGTMTENGRVTADSIGIYSDGTLTLSGNEGMLVSGSQPVLISAATSLTLADGTSIDVGSFLTNGTLTVQTPLIILGTVTNTLDAVASLTDQFGTINIQSNQSQTGSFELSLLNGVQAGELSLSARNSNVTSNSVTTDAGTILIASNNLTITAAQSATLGCLLNYTGSMIVNVTNGSLAISPNAELVDCSGTINITATSWMEIGANVMIEASGGGVWIGNPNQYSPPIGKQSPRHIIVLNAGGSISLPATFAENASATSEIVAIKQSVDIGSTVGLGGGDLIAAINVAILTSLDLTNSQTVRQIETDQADGLIGGSFIPKNGHGTEKTVTLNPLFVAPVVVGENIPAGVTVTLEGFSGATPLCVLLNGQETNAIIDGTENFIGTGGTLISSTTSGGGLTLGTGGVITSTGNLSFYVSGNVILDGTISAKETLAIETQADAAGNSSISIGGTVGSTSTTVALTAAGSGNIVETATSAVVAGRSLGFATGLGNIGSSTSSFMIETASLTVDTSTSGNGSVNIYDTKALELMNSAAGGDIEITDSGTLTTDSINSNDGSVLLKSTGKLIVAKEAKIIAGDGNVSLNSSSLTGTITIDSKAAISASGATSSTGYVTIWTGSSVPLQANTKNPQNVTTDLISGGIVFYGAKGISAVSPTNTIDVTASTVTFSTGTSNSKAIALDGDVTITATQATAFENTEVIQTELVVDTGDEPGSACDSVE